MRFLLALLLFALSAGVHAQSGFTRATAWSACTTRAGEKDVDFPHVAPHRCEETPGSTSASGSLLMVDKDGNPNGLFYQWNGEGCPSGGRWNPAKNLCAPSEEQCKAMPDLGRGITTGGNTSTCSGGCEFKPQTLGGGALTIGFDDGTAMTPATAWQASGGMCGANTPAPPPDKDQECKPIGTQTMCVKPDGQQCASASNGRQVCWKPGETGEKTDGPVLQKRNAGPTEIPPSNVNLPSGDTLQKQGQSITTTSTNSSTSTTTTTTTTNYTTVNGTNAGDTNSGENGTGDGSGQEGDGEGDEGSASGGQDCASAPVMTGDPVLIMVAQQEWLSRCGTSKGDANGDGRPDWTEPGEGVPEGQYLGEDGQAPEMGVVGEDFEPDTSGFGWGQSCPAIPDIDVFGTTLSLDANGVFCDWMQLGGWFVLLIAGLRCLRMLTEA